MKRISVTLALLLTQTVCLTAGAQARPAARPTPRARPAPTAAVLQITPVDPNTPAASTPAAGTTANTAAGTTVAAGASNDGQASEPTAIDITATPAVTPQVQTSSQNTAQNRARASQMDTDNDNDDPLADADPRESQPCVSPSPAMPTVAMVPALTAQDYVRRSNILFGTVGIGVAPPQGVVSDNVAGISTAMTLRVVYNHFLIDPSFGLSYVPSNSVVTLQIQPALRLGYTGAVSNRMALGFRAGYGLLWQPVGSNRGVIHALDADIHLTMVSERGLLIEPYLTLGATIANPIWPTAMLGLRMGYWL